MVTRVEWSRLVADPQTAARSEAPADATPSGVTEQLFRVWVHTPTYLEDAVPWKCMATFRFLLDALEYCAAQQDRGIDVVLQSGVGSRAIRASEDRCVYRGAD